MWTIRCFRVPGNLIRAEADVAVKGILTDQTFGRVYTNLLQYLPLGKREPVRVPRRVWRGVHGGQFEWYSRVAAVPGGRCEFGARLRLSGHW